VGGRAQLLYCRGLNHNRTGSLRGAAPNFGPQKAKRLPGKSYSELAAKLLRPARGPHSLKKETHPHKQKKRILVKKNPPVF